MKKIVYCCDICGKEIKNYDNIKDCIKFKVISTNDRMLTDDSNTKDAEVYRDLCLHCLATTVTIDLKADGVDCCTRFIELIDKRSKEVV